MDNINLNQQIIQNYNLNAPIISKYQGLLENDSIIIVSQNEDAVIVKQMQIQYILKSGKYYFTAVNFPNVFIDKFKKDDLLELLFINKHSKIVVDWGTTHPLQIQEHYTKILLNIIAYGQFNLFVEKSDLIINQIKEHPNLIDDDDALKDYLFNQFIDYIKNFLTKTITKIQSDILTICSNTDYLSRQIEENMRTIFSQYGFKLESFTIFHMQVQENKQFELYQRTLQQNEQLAQISKTYQDNSFPPPTTVVVGDFTNCEQIQIGSTNTQQSIGMNIEEISLMIQLILDSLSKMQLENNKKEAILYEVKVLKDELKKRPPKKAVISKAFSSIKSILEGIAGSLAASGLIECVKLFL